MLPPWLDVAPYWILAGKFPAEWASILSLYQTALDDVDAPECNLMSVRLIRLSPSALVTTSSFVCSRCGDRFASQKALQAHSRSKHRTRSEVVARVGDIAVCPICHTNFHSRLRLITHLSESRVRSVKRGVSCRTEFLQAAFPLVDEVELGRLNDIDRRSRREARTRGHTHEIAHVPASRTLPSVLTKAIRIRRRLSVKTTVPAGVFSCAPPVGLVGVTRLPRYRLSKKTAGAKRCLK